MAALNAVANFRFAVEIDAITLGAFSEVQIGDSTIEVIDYREGNNPLTRKIPGLTKYANVTFKRGVTASNELFNWWKAAAEGNVQRRNVAVTLLDEQRNVVRRWLMRDVWPVRYAVSPLIAADGCAAATETLECAVESLESEAP
jgi:phage tail-like protein